ncbi:MAG: tetratricopeptide repeat protein [candidate division Zixibacteria bacterium]|nr:tetratricopeptide repeat protein [candidate division Zixibacteria bacterium]
MRKTSMTIFKSVLAVMFVAASGFAEDYVDQVKNGNDAFRNGDYKTALECYHSAEVDLPESPELEYNMAGALYREGAYEEAVDKYGRAMNTTDIDLESAAHYNLGNTQFRIGDYQKAIERYQKALEINPGDVDAKYNLELARRKLKDQMKSQEQEQQQQQQKQQQDQQQQQQEQEQEEQDQQQQQQDQQEEQQEPQQPQPQDEKEMSQEDAERILNALRDDEQEIQEKIKRQRAVGDYTGKDW